MVLQDTHQGTVSKWLFEKRKQFQMTGHQGLHSESPPWRGNSPFLLDVSV